MFSLKLNHRIFCPHFRFSGFRHTFPEKLILWIQLELPASSLRLKWKSVLVKANLSIYVYCLPTFWWSWNRKVVKNANLSIKTNLINVKIWNSKLNFLIQLMSYKELAIDWTEPVFILIMPVNPSVGVTYSIIPISSSLNELWTTLRSKWWRSTVKNNLYQQF